MKSEANIPHRNKHCLKLSIIFHLTHEEFTARPNSRMDLSVPGWDSRVWCCATGCDGSFSLCYRERVSVKQLSTGTTTDPQDISLQQGTDFLRPLSSLCFQSCSNSMSGTSHSLWDAAVESPAHPWDHPSLGSSIPGIIHPWDHPLLCVLRYLCRWGGGTARSCRDSLGVKPSPAEFLLCKRRSCVMAPSGTGILGMFWWTHADPVQEE